MTRQERILAITSGAEAVLLAYGALSAFLTPVGAREHHVLLAIVLLGIALPLAWYAASATIKVTHPSDPLMLRVTVPNGALLFMCFSGSLESGPGSHGMMPGLVGALALALAATAIRQTRVRLSGEARPVRP